MIGPLLWFYIIAGCVSFLLYLYMVYPILFLHAYFRLSVYLCGMKLKYLRVDGLSICYGEKGKRQSGKPSMLLLHGFTADKFMWVPLVKNLSPDTHVIAVDLPGHGDSDTPSDDQDISDKVTVLKMKKLISQMSIDEHQFHLVGMSMGGALAGLYAAEYPEDIHSLTMICPAMRTPTVSPFWQEMCEAVDAKVEELHITCDLLFPTTATQVQYMLDVVQYHKMWVPTKMLEAVVQWRKKYYPFYSRLFKELTDVNNHDLLESQVHKIQAPTQVIWGEQDQVIDSSGAELLRTLLPNCVQVDIIPRCGHSISMDRPGSLTKALLTFRHKLLGEKR